eukprot:CAMPEP_0184480660 /NCGR_PEP_ID=MMETSP0113_2-20130426/2178_1 /TAXON_ID=91329 /ORGANISM="Norrisiella sphaerica, Strain BC52" /LENGTH=66 /DNA_ID=CAMNT_0026859291 /DNA_START=63 /DNA_END=263 /DNA_ORIENTATION=+
MAVADTGRRRESEKANASLATDQLRNTQLVMVMAVVLGREGDDDDNTIDDSHMKCSNYAKRNEGHC